MQTAHFSMNSCVELAHPKNPAPSWRFFKHSRVTALCNDGNHTGLAMHGLAPVSNAMNTDTNHNIDTITINGKINY